MELWQERLIDEKEELLKKYLRLRGFIDSGAPFHQLDDIDQNLMKQQLNVMKEYYNILEQRVNKII